MTIQDVALHLNMSWHTIKEIDKVYLNKHYNKPRLKDVEYIAIDEFAYKKHYCPVKIKILVLKFLMYMQRINLSFSDDLK